MSPEDASMLDGLDTEASNPTGSGPEIDQLPVTDLLGLMNTRDATIAEAVRSALPAIAAAVTAATERMRKGGRLIYVGAGTSGRLGVLDAAEVPPTFGVEDVVGVIAGGPAALVEAAEGVEDDREAGAADLAALGVGPLDTVVGVASSGRTPYVLAALEHAAGAGALTVGLACNLDSPLARSADHGIEVPVGPEVVSGSTRLGAGTATKMVLNMISTATMVQLGRTYGSLMVDMRASNEKLRHRAVRMVTEATGADATTATAALEAARWHAKLAIATILTGLSPAEASQALDLAGGRLRTVLEERG